MKMSQIEKQVTSGIPSVDQERRVLKLPYATLYQSEMSLVWFLDILILFCIYTLLWRAPTKQNISFDMLWFESDSLYALLSNYRSYLQLDNIFP